MVPCPVCNVMTPRGAINEHLDKCVAGGEERPAAAPVQAPRTSSGQDALRLAEGSGASVVALSTIPGASIT